MKRSNPNVSKRPLVSEKNPTRAGTESQEPECPIRANYRAQRMVCRAATEPGCWADLGRKISASATARSGGKSWFMHS